MRSSNCFLAACVQAGWPRQVHHPTVEKQASSWLRGQSPLSTAFFLRRHLPQLLFAWDKQPHDFDAALQKGDWNFTALNLHGQTLLPVLSQNTASQPHASLQKCKVPHGIFHHLGV